MFTYGTRVIDRPVYPNVVQETYCVICNETTTLSKFEGQKEWYFFFIPLKKIDKPFYFLKCLQCDTNYHMDYPDEGVYRTTGENSAIFRK
jgi:hypothetical protein